MSAATTTRHKLLGADCPTKSSKSADKANVWVGLAQRQVITTDKVVGFCHVLGLSVAKVVASQIQKCLHAYAGIILCNTKASITLAYSGTFLANCFLRTGRVPGK